MANLSSPFVGYILQNMLIYKNLQKLFIVVLFVRAYAVWERKRSIFFLLTFCYVVSHSMLIENLDTLLSTYSGRDSNLGLCGSKIYPWGPL